MRAASARRFNRVVVATGARYRFGLGALVPRLLDAGLGRGRIFQWLFNSPAIPDWFYYRARRATGERAARLARPDQKVIVIGDARVAGKGREAIADAFRAAMCEAKAGFVS